MPGEKTQQTVSFRDKIPDNYFGSRSICTVVPQQNEKHAKAHHYLQHKQDCIIASLYSIRVKMKKTVSNEKKTKNPELPFFYSVEK